MLGRREIRAMGRRGQGGRAGSLKRCCLSRGLAGVRGETGGGLGEEASAKALSGGLDEWEAGAAAATGPGYNQCPPSPTLFFPPPRARRQCRPQHLPGNSLLAPLCICSMRQTLPLYR